MLQAASCSHSIARSMRWLWWAWGRAYCITCTCAVCRSRWRVCFPFPIILFQVKENVMSFLFSWQKVKAVMESTDGLLHINCQLNGTHKCKKINWPVAIVAAAATDPVVERKTAAFGQSSSAQNSELLILSIWRNWIWTYTQPLNMKGLQLHESKEIKN